MSTRTTQRSRLTVGLLLLLTGCGSSSNDSEQPIDGDGAAGQVAAGSGGSTGSAGTSGPIAGSGDQAGSGGDSAGSGAMTGGGGPSWTNDVHPALVGGCNGCHADSSSGPSGPPRPGLPGMEGGANAPGKFAVDDAHAAFMAVAPLVVAGDAGKSSLYIKISEDMPSNGGQRMPPALRQWDDASIQLVHDWIAAGAKEN
jgi:hypothetical protein